MNTIIMIKLGGSLITDKKKAYTVRKGVVENLAAQISRAVCALPETRFVIGNGAGSFAHYPAQKFKMVDGIQNEEQKNGFCFVQDAAARLNRIVVSGLLRAGVRALTLNPSSFIITNRRKIKTLFLDPMLKLFQLGITPVVYGDIVCDETHGSCILSTERVLSSLALRLSRKGWRVVRIIHTGITQGVLDPRGQIIDRITKKSFRHIVRGFSKTEGYDVTGGMFHKVKEALALAEHGIQSMIINGVSEKDLLYRAIIGEKVRGTRVSEY